MKIRLLSALSLLFLSGQVIAQTAYTGMRDITAIQITEDMAPGVNLWNTLDAHCSWNGDDQGLVTETCWGNPYTSPEMIAGIAQRGFKTLRLPVTWYMHTGGAPEYTIDPLWLDRVEEVANYAFDNDMYVIVNIHHDDKHDETTSQWLNPTAEDSTQNIAQLEAMWTQIANRFKDYGDYMIFETMNEPREVGSAEEWSGGSAEHRAIINRYNVVAVNAIRATGGNNAQRFIMTPQVGANSGAALSDMIIANDDERVIVAIHAYTPYNFALNENNTDFWGSASDVQAIQNLMQQIEDKFTSKGIGVVMGEWGVASNKDLDQRIHYYDVYTEACKGAGIVPIPWMYGYNRHTLSWETPELEKSILKHYYEEVDEVQFQLPSDTMYVGDEVQLTATYSPSSVAVDFERWETNDYEKATITDDGLLTAITKGTVNVSVSINGAWVEHELLVLDTVQQTSFFIEAEDYDDQSGLQAYPSDDATDEVAAGEIMGNLTEGDWSSYTVIIDAPGYYDLWARCASPSSGGWVDVYVNGELATQLDVDASGSEGWGDWFTTGTTELELEAGVIELKMVYDTDDWGLFNVNWFQLEFDRPFIATSTLEELAGLSVYPNPTSGFLYLSESSDYIVTDLVGVNLLSGTSKEIDLSGLKSGTYFVQAGGQVTKVIKN